MNICVLSGNCWQYKDYAAERLKTLSVNVVHLLYSQQADRGRLGKCISSCFRKPPLPRPPITLLKSVLRRQEVFLSSSSKSVFVTGQLHGLLVRARVWLCEEDQMFLRLQLTHPIRSHSGRDSTNLEFRPWTN
jgi:hypothetical protein